ncbi:YodL domain-containing protein [Fusobacterium necrophorum]|uniref:PF14195 domain protein n=2 Tax=Fusobacterium necrophorum TaxID=859 RepID=A0AAN3VVB5_9FUSO|nr:YodL domain-containing protein [Fusobacterium necrophorum]EJU16593.1 PF14195 domain protein [Fusobacterium necrophorum subsp. funduliforme Fnf 1007]MDK4474107.1 YodL domain-containing protein [Fusobacterium necrophorum]MDK4480033.1 YodL domain-containing protein [Fusobacterium necrophorum]MDK4483292.1 YodL domain-containing protein [Fusobacterium necrophorum]MDK4495360.1 YodL domain-containing protein [Fusobacterium necrophorum]
MQKITLENRLLMIDTNTVSFDMQEIENRRFMYSPDSCELIIGEQYKGNDLIVSHAEEHGKAGAKAPFDNFIRGWIGTGKGYKDGVIHFAPPINTHNIDRFNHGFSTLEMFSANGANSRTIIRGFGDRWEQPLSDLISQEGEKAMPYMKQTEEIKEVTPIVLTSENQKDRLKEITDRLEQGILEVFESERYKEYLRVISKFHHYSFNNTMLIALQKPDASLIAGFSAWKNSHGRTVKKGEKGIRIIAPAPFKVKQEMEKLDPKTNMPVMGADGKAVTEEREITIPAYKVVSVFDVSQTEGKELPSIGVNELTGDVSQYEDFFTALKKASPVPIALEHIEGSAHGYYHLAEKRIAIDDNMSELQTLKTAIHEIAHAKLHDIDLNAPKEEKENHPNQRTREVEAESVAYTVCRHYGLDTSDYSFGYVAGWSSGKELSELKGSLEAIRLAASELIDSIDGHFKELQRERENELSEKEMKSPLQEEKQEAAYLLESGNYLYIQTCKTGYDYTLYQPDFTDLDGGQLDNPEISIEKARDEILKMHELSGQGLEEILIDDFEKMQEEASQEKDVSVQVKYYPINEAAAKRAKEMNSFSDYTPGSATLEYKSLVDQAAEIAENQKKRVDPSFHEKIDALLDTYSKKLAVNMNNGFAIDSRVPSVLIAGGSNFPTRKKEKQNAARDKNYGEWKEIQGLLEKIRSTGMGGISADDPDAVKKLTAKLEKLTKAQETMKAVNAYYRKHKSLEGCPELDGKAIEKLKTRMEIRGIQDKPYPSWALSNNNAEIRRIKERIQSLSVNKDKLYTGWEFAGGKAEINVKDNRLQLFFDDKPDGKIRDELKANGFRWSPKASAWQRQLNSNAIYAADAVSSIKPLSGERVIELQRNFRKEERKEAQPEYIYKAQEEVAEKDTFQIYQLKRGENTRELQFESYDRLKESRQTLNPDHYVKVYEAELTKGLSLEDIYTRFNIDHPKDFYGHSLSVSDVVVLHKDGKDSAHYVDRFGYKDAPEFLKPQNYLKHVEDIVEQNDNNFDGIINNTPNAPTVSELEQKIKAGEAISLTELAKAVKVENRNTSEPEKKPSIREQLKEAKKQSEQKKHNTKIKNHELEV